MTYTQTNILVTLRTMIDTQPDNAFRTALLFQLDWLENSISKDAEIIEGLEYGLDRAKGMTESYKVSLQVEQKWRKELGAENAHLHEQLEDVTEAYEVEMDAAEFEHFSPIKGRVSAWNEVCIVRKASLKDAFRIKLPTDNHYHG